MTFKLIKGEAAISKAIDGVRAKGNAYRNAIHNAACSILYHWVDTGDVRVAVRLTADLLNAVNYEAQALSDWFTGFAGFSIEKTKSVATVSYTKTTIDATAFRDGRDTPFWVFTPPADVKPMNLKAMLSKLINKADKRMSKPVEGDQIDTTILEALHKLVA